VDNAAVPGDVGVSSQGENCFKGILQSEAFNQDPLSIIKEERSKERRV